MKNKIMNIIYYYTYFTLSIVFIAGMLGGLLDGDNIPAAIELGAVGIVINPKFEGWIRTKVPGYSQWASIDGLSQDCILHDKSAGQYYVYIWF